MSIDNEEPTSPSLPWRAASTATILVIGFLSKAFLATCTSKSEAIGLASLTQLLREREDVGQRERGLLTVSNHVSVVDDPLIWGFLPLRTLSNPDNIRWSLGSYDICFKDGASSVLGKFFTLGQTLPTHRHDYSPYGSPFQPTIAQCIRLLSSGPFTTPIPPHPDWPPRLQSPTETEDIHDPFSNPTFSYSTTSLDVFPAPSAYGTRRYSWVHIFPEGKVHQHPDRMMRYFKWGVARLILESEPCPTVLPIWIEGPEEVMHESRPWPRWFPRLGKQIVVSFGEPISETVWSGFRERWKRLREREIPDFDTKTDVGLLSQELMTGREASELRMEVAYKVREMISDVRRKRGLPNEDPKARLVDTYRNEGGRREGEKDDGSWVRDT